MKSLYFIVALILSIIFALIVKKLALKLGVVDKPDGERKLHSKPIPLLGGVAIFLSFWLVVFYLVYRPVLGTEILTAKMWGAFFGSVILIAAGYFDDKKGISVKIRFLLAATATLLAIWGGVEISKMTNPFGGIWEFGLTLGNVIVFFWLMGMMFTTKILDGLDGLATGIVAIGAMMIYFLTETARFYQPNVGLLALIFAGACLGLLIFNFYPAKIFLGEVG